MVKTTDLVADLRTCLRGECSACGHECGNADCLDRIMEDAADRLEELVIRCARYAEEIAVLRERQKWIPVTERLPEDDGHYLCRYGFKGAGSTFYQTLDYYATDVQPHFQHEGTHGMRVTHWMPLPEAPEVD
nr:MAG TPA: Protein of unknown function (DUF551) [Caudoviricetes sp.]